MTLIFLLLKVHCSLNFNLKPMASTTLSKEQKIFQFHYQTKQWSTNEQRTAILIIGLLHIPMTLCLNNIGETQGRWHIFSFLFYSFTSISYNIAMMLDGRRLYLAWSTWKKLKHISGMSLLNLSIIYLMNLSKYPKIRVFLEYLQFAFILISQEGKSQKYHWNWYPIVFHCILCFVIQTYSILIASKMPGFDYKNAAISFVLFGCAYFASMQIKALYTFDAQNEADDYLRIYHSVCDMFVCLGFHWFWRILPQKKTFLKIQRLK